MLTPHYVGPLLCWHRTMSGICYVDTSLCWAFVMMTPHYVGLLLCWHRTMFCLSYICHEPCWVVVLLDPQYMFVLLYMQESGAMLGPALHARVRRYVWPCFIRRGWRYVGPCAMMGPAVHTRVYLNIGPGSMFGPALCCVVGTPPLRLLFCNSWYCNTR